MFEMFALVYVVLVSLRFVSSGCFDLRLICFDFVSVVFCLRCVTHVFDCSFSNTFGFC